MSVPDKTERQVDPDIANALPALQRAAVRARERAKAAGVRIPVFRDGRIVEEAPEPPEAGQTDAD